MTSCLNSSRLNIRTSCTPWARAYCTKAWPNEPVPPVMRSLPRSVRFFKRYHLCFWSKQLHYACRSSSSSIRGSLCPRYTTVTLLLWSQPTQVTKLLSHEVQRNHGTATNDGGRGTHCSPTYRRRRLAHPDAARYPDSCVLRICRRTSDQARDNQIGHKT